MFFKFLKGATLVGALTALMCGSVFADITKNISLSFSGLIDVDAAYSSISNQPNSSDFDVDNAALNVVAKLGEEFTGTIVFWYEQLPNDAFYVDEAKIEWQKNDKLSFTLGKFYIISTISSEFITDAMAASYIELWKTAAMVSYKPMDYLTLKAAVYNGSVQKNTKENDHIRDFVLAAECANDNFGLNVAYLSNGVEVLDSGVIALDSYSKTGSTLVISGTAKIDKFRFLAETAMPTSKPVATLTNPGKISFSVYDLVAGYQFTDKLGADIRYEQAKDKLDGILQQKNTNIIGQLTYAYNENVTIKAEYLNKEEKNAATKTETDQFTARVSYSF